MSETNVVLIGVFDGVHKGHQQLLNRAKEIADGRAIVALTFDPHPTTVYAPTKVPTALTTLADRVELLKIHNADQVAVMKFNENFAAMSAEDFVANVLVGQLNASTVVVWVRTSPMVTKQPETLIHLLPKASNTISQLMCKNLKQIPKSYPPHVFGHW